MGILCLLFVVTGIQAQDIPYVYTVENTGKGFATPSVATVSQQYFPDPFRWVSDPNGTRYTDFSDWSRHRAEFKYLIETYEIGTKPDVYPSQVTASYSGGTLTVNITVNGKTCKLTCAVTLPSGAGPFPAVIGMNSGTGSLPASSFTSRSIAQITFSHDQVTTYNNPTTSDPFFQLYPAQNTTNTGQYAAWSWGVSRIIDGLEKTQSNLPIDLKHIAVTGCSYAGKMALFAGAFDERIALTIAQESGGGGATSWRYSATESSGSVEGLAQTDYRWFKDDMKNFSSNLASMPVDHHMLMAMCAPRALYVTGNTDYTWLSNPSCYVVSRATQQIYNTLGIADRFGFGIDGGHTHCGFPSGFQADLDYFLNKFMKAQTTLTRSVQTYPSSYSSISYATWYQWWGNAATAVPGTPGPTSVPTAVPTQGPTAVPGTISIACGSSSAVGSFQADQYYSGGSTYNNTNTIDVSGITSNPPPAALFNNERYGAMSYTIPGFTSGGSYEVTLYFAETYLTSSGSRLFSVSINGTTALSDFDIYASAGGQNKAVAKSFTTTANGSGQIVIQFTAGTENPKVNGIGIVPDSSAGTIGDVNRSGTIDIVDALLVAQFYVGLAPQNFDESLADVNCSGTVDIVDALRIAQYYVGLVTSLSC